MTLKPPQKPAKATQSDKPWVADIFRALDSAERKPDPTTGLPRRPLAAMSGKASAPKDDGKSGASPSGDGPTAPQFDEKKHIEEMAKAAEAQKKAKEIADRDAQGSTVRELPKGSPVDSGFCPVVAAAGRKHAEEQAGFAEKNKAADEGYAEKARRDREGISR